MPKISGIIRSSGVVDRGASALYVPCDDSQKSYILVNNNRSRQYPASSLPQTTSTNKDRLPIIVDGVSLLIAGLRSSFLVVDTYVKTGKQYIISRTENIAPTAVRPRVTNMKRLKSGAVLMVWYKEIFGTFKSYPCFSYRRPDGTWTTLEAEWDSPSAGMPWLSADFAQDNSGGIWYFGQHDSNHQLACIHLTDTGNEVKIDWINTQFTPRDNVLACESESPYIVCESYGEGIILAYQSKDYKFFSTSPFCKGAKINVTTVSPTGSHSLLYQTADYAERVIPFAMLGSSIVYAPINPATLQYMELHHLKSDGSSAILGPTDWPQWFRNTQSHYAYNVAGKIKISVLDA